MKIALVLLLFAANAYGETTASALKRATTIWGEFAKVQVVRVTSAQGKQSKTVTTYQVGCVMNFTGKNTPEEFHPVAESTVSYGDAFAKVDYFRNGTKSLPSYPPIYYAPGAPLYYVICTDPAGKVWTGPR